MDIRYAIFNNKFLAIYETFEEDLNSLKKMVLYDGSNVFI